MGIFISIVIIALDQYTKQLAISNLMGKRPIVLIENLLELHFVKNYGAAFGILQNQRTFFIIITSLVILGGIAFLFLKKDKVTKFGKFSSWVLIGGAIGNLIDRVRLEYVVDFIKIDLGSLYDFPVFNVADIFIVAGTGLLIIAILFDKFDIREQAWYEIIWDLCWWRKLR